MISVVNYPQAYIEYLVNYHGLRDYFECHEVLEEYWKEHPDSPFRVTWVGLIQLAVAMYHHRRGNWKGAVKMLTSAIRLLDEDNLGQLGIDAVQLKLLMKDRLFKLEQNTPLVFQDMNIPFSDSALEEQVTKIRTDDVVIDPYILNKHTLRDRSEVIRTRQAEWVRRNSN
jgi:predicted metal-dependent hydrolase